MIAKLTERSVQQPGLFDDPEPEPAEFRIAPHAAFLGWDRRARLAYMIARDLDSARTAVERGEEPGFYLARAEGYRADLAEGTLP